MERVYSSNGVLMTLTAANEIVETHEHQGIVGLWELLDTVETEAELKRIYFAAVGLVC